MTILTKFESTDRPTIADLQARAGRVKRELDGAPLTPGAMRYLTNYNGDRQRLEAEARLVAAEYGSLKTHRLHCVIAAKRGEYASTI